MCVCSCSCVGLCAYVPVCAGVSVFVSVRLYEPVCERISACLFTHACISSRYTPGVGKLRSRWRNACKVATDQKPYSCNEGVAPTLREKINLV